MSIKLRSKKVSHLYRLASSLVFLLLVGATLSKGTAAQVVVAPPFKVATFDVDATPPVGSAMAYDPVRRVDELTLRCRGIVLLGGEQPIVLCAVDWIGIANEGHDAFRDALAKAAGTTREFVAVHSLHQHDAPGCDLTAERLLSELDVNPRQNRFEGTFHRQVMALAADAVRQSMPTAQPVTHYGWAEAEVEKVASNRRILGDDGMVRAVRFTTCRDPEIRAEPEGVIDPEVSLLSFWNQDQPVAVLSYYACHPQSYYRTGVPSPDFPGIARFIRGQELPDTLHVHFNGAGGNIGAGKYNDGNKANRMMLAQRMADGMKRAFESTVKHELNRGDVGWESFPVKLTPADHLVRKDLIEAIRTQPLKGYIDNADQLAWLERCDSGHEIDISCLRVGDARILHMPGELFVEYQLSAKLMRPDLNVAMAAYGDYGPGYIGTQIAYSQGGYETSTRASNVTPEAERTLTQALRQLLKKPQPANFATEQSAVDPYAGPKSPNQALSTFELPTGFEMQLVASEPNVREPVAICYDEGGQMYAAEFLKFPTVHGESDGPAGRIRLLRDLDQDGHYEQSTVFADKLDWPTGVCPWDGGVFVIAAPDLWYLKDTDGDGRADIRKKVFTGFGFNNEEGTANNLVFGLDHWIYGAGSNSGGSIVQVDQPDATAVSIRGSDFRFHPATLEFESISGAEQFGNTFDDYGNRFLCQNSKPAVHVVFPAHYLKRNPYQNVGRVRQDIWKGNEVFRISEPEPWRIARTKIRLEADREWAAPFVAHDVFTACTGVTIYRGDVYPQSMFGNLVVGDVQSNLVHRRRLEPESVSFLAKRIDQQSELIRSTDNWFRPVNFCNSPDGTLHVVDMYREVIETPDSLPEKVLSAVDLNRGHSMGRIYRLAPIRFRPPVVPQLESASSAELAGFLGHANGWWRDTASRLLFERQDKSVIPELRRRLENSDSVLERLHLLYGLQGMGALNANDIGLAIDDASAALRVHGVQLAEQWLEPKQPAFEAAAANRLVERIASLANDSDDRVRFQTALTLGEFEQEAAGTALAAILKRDINHPWIQTAVLSSAYHHAAQILSLCLADDRVKSTSSWKGALHALALVVGGRIRKDELAELVGYMQAHAESEHCQTVMLGIAEGLANSRSNLREVLGGSDLEFAYAQLSSALKRARIVMQAPDSTETERIEAIQMLSQDFSFDSQSSLFDLIDAAQAPAVQLAAIQALSSFSDPGIAKALLNKCQRVSPAIRNEIFETLLSRREWAIEMLNAIESGGIPIASIQPMHRSRMLRSNHPIVQSQAKNAFKHWELLERSDAITRYLSAVESKGNSARGQRVFQTHCSTCHQFRDLNGHDVGPNLMTVQGRTAEQLLIQILDPNRELLGSYTVYVVSLTDGRFLSGMIAAETPTSITLKRAEGIEETILRRNIDEISASGKSLMPEGLESSITPEEMSDLLTFLTIQ